MDHELPLIELVHAGDGGCGALMGEGLAPFGAGKMLTAENFESG